MSSSAQFIKKSHRSESSDSASSSVASSPCSSSPLSNWRIQYKRPTMKPPSKGAWGGCQTRDEFLALHLR